MSSQHNRAQTLARRMGRWDRNYVWHPFTQMRDWMRQEPIIILSGKGAVLTDARGRDYLDANSSIWTNLHGHAHPRVNTAIAGQLRKVAHSSALGLANAPATVLAKRLVELANPSRAAASQFAGPRIRKVFFSDDGSTAVEVALKMAYEFARRAGRSRQPKFVSMQGGYHGDTVGAVSLGHIDLFHKAYSGLLFDSGAVMSPYCYRCPYNRAQPERADARTYRKCRWECVDQVEKTFSRQAKLGNSYSGFVVEPLIQGAAGMIPQPAGWLRRVADIARDHRALLIADEVMTGFGRTGSTFACHQERVRPDLMAVAKGMTGGYLPMAATLTTQEVFDAFLGDYSDFKTFFHGHSFTGNQLGSVAALASLDLLADPQGQRARARIESVLASELRSLWSLPAVGDVRQVGLIAGIELVSDWRSRAPFPLRERAGIRVCEAMARRGVLTRPIGNVVVLMPPYCTTPPQMRRIAAALHESIEEVL